MVRKKQKKKKNSERQKTGTSPDVRPSIGEWTNRYIHNLEYYPEACNNVEDIKTSMLREISHTQKSTHRIIQSIGVLQQAE